MEAEQDAPHILIVDDDTAIREMLSQFLRGHGLVTAEAANGIEMFTQIKKKRPTIILLDIMMPGEDGLSLCRKLQADGAIPVILLTAVDSETDRIIGLELGADDYVTKPFNPRELLARIRALLRRTAHGSGSSVAKKSPLYHFAGWTMNTNRRTLISADGTLVVLTSAEFDLLSVFAENAQQTINRDKLLDALHGRTSHAFDRSMDVQISRLRRKIEQDPQNPVLIKTIRNEGYFFTPDVSSGGDDV